MMPPRVTGLWSSATDRAWPADVACITGFVLIVAASMAAGVVFSEHQQSARLAVVAVACAGFGAVARNLLASLVTSGIAWTFLNGFVVHDQGDLRWEENSDAVRLSVLVAAAVLGTVAGWLWHALRAWVQSHAGRQRML